MSDEHTEAPRELGTYRTTEYRTNRRLAKMRISPDFLLEICKGGEPRRVRLALNALSDDVRSLGAQYHVLAGCWELLLTSESFAEVDDGVEAPTLLPPVWEYVTESQELQAEQARADRLAAALQELISAGRAVHATESLLSPAIAHARALRRYEVAITEARAALAGEPAHEPNPTSSPEGE